MFLIGSRNLGIEDSKSDYDYIELDLEKCDTYKDIQNIFIAPKQHCYHMSKEYIDRCAIYELQDPEDYTFIYNPEFYRVSAIDVYPFDYRDKWIEKLKAFNFYHYNFYAPGIKKFSKNFYHIVFNLECLKQNTLYPTMERVKLFHDMRASEKDYRKVIEEIMNL